jgi:hypothetical protein
VEWRDVPHHRGSQNGGHDSIALAAVPIAVNDAAGLRPFVMERLASRLLFQCDSCLLAADMECNTAG